MGPRTSTRVPAAAVNPLLFPTLVAPCSLRVCGHRAVPGVLLAIPHRQSPGYVICVLRDDLPILGINNIADAIFGSAVTGEIRIPFRVIRIVVLMRQFLPFLNIT